MKLNRCALSFKGRVRLTKEGHYVCIPIRISCLQPLNLEQVERQDNLTGEKTAEKLKEPSRTLGCRQPTSGHMRKVSSHSLSRLSAPRALAQQSDPQSPQMFLYVDNALANNNTLCSYIALNFSK